MSIIHAQIQFNQLVTLVPCLAADKHLKFSFWTSKKKSDILGIPGYGLELEPWGDPRAFGQNAEKPAVNAKFHCLGLRALFPS